MPVNEPLATLAVPVTSNDHIQGPPVAVVTLVEYGDYECPHCGRAYPIVKDVQRHMGPKLRFVFRNFPLGEIHPHAEHAAEAAEAAAAQNLFWEMHDTLFENQDALDDRSLVQYAQDISADAKRVSKELAAHVYSARVRADFLSGVRSGVNGTPTFFINGVRYDGSWDLESLLAALRKPV